jgi:hypothetical protein
VSRIMAVTAGGRPVWPPRRPALLAWTLWALTILGHVPILWFDHIVRQAGRPDLIQALPLLPHLLAEVGAATVGALLASRRPRHPVGWLLLVFGLAGTILGIFQGYAFHILATRPGELMVAGYAALLSLVFFYPVPAAMSFIMLLTPTGSLPSPRWRPLAAVIVVAPLVALVADTFGSYPLIRPVPALRSPLAVPALAGPLQLVASVAGPVIGLAALAAAGSLVVRFRRARGMERQQLRWVALVVTTWVPVAALVTIVANLLDHPAVGSWGTGLAVLGVHLAIYAAIARYRLYDLDRIISRTLAWGLLTVLLGGGYAVVVLGLGQVLGRDSSLVVAGATLAVAALFQPARHRIQRAVDRRFNRRRHDAARTIAAFNDRLHQHLDLDTLTVEVLAVVEETMQPTQASLWLRPAPNGRSRAGRASGLTPLAQR